MVDSDVGGQVQGISLESFLQMVQMEKSTCTLKVIAEGEMGFIYILKGEMISAVTGVIEGLDAALEIISWDDSVIEIENKCEKTEDIIQTPLMTILEEGLQRRGPKSSETPAGAPPPLELPTMPPDEEEDAGPKAAPEKPQSPSDTGTPPRKRPPRKASPKQTRKAKKAPKRKKKRPSMVMVAGLLIALAGAGYFFFMQSGSGDELRYNALQERLASIAEPEVRKDLIEAFLDTQPEPEFAEAAKTQLSAVINEIASSAFKKVDSRAQKLVGENKPKTAIAAYQNFIQQYPDSAVIRQAKQKIDDIVAQMADAEYKTLGKAIENRDADQIDRMVAFKEAYPASAHVEKIDAAIADLADDYYNYIKRRLGLMVKNEKWKESRELVLRFVSLYPENPHAGEFKQLAALFQRRLQEKTAFAQLMQEVDQSGPDIAAAKKRLEDYIAAYPDVYTRKRIEDRIGEYDRQLETTRLSAARKAAAAKLQTSGSRFTIRDDGVFTDRRTGKMWTLLDSETALLKCVDYRSAKSYVSGLTSGGFTNWRLPTPDELAGLYRGEPAFTAGDSDWYWTSKAIRRYSGQWYVFVTVLDRQNRAQPVLSQKEARDCGSALAIRP